MDQGLLRRQGAKEVRPLVPKACMDQKVDSGSPAAPSAGSSGPRYFVVFREGSRSNELVNLSVSERSLARQNVE